MKEKDSIRIMREYSCFKMKSYTAFRAQFLSCPHSWQRRCFPTGVTSSGGQWLLFRPAHNWGQGTYHLNCFQSPLETHASSIVIIFQTSSWSTFHVIWHTYKHMSWFGNFTFQLPEKPSEAGNNAGTLWCGETGQMRGLALEMKVSPPDFLWLYMQEETSHNHHYLICTGTHTYISQRVLVQFTKRQITPTYKPPSSSCCSLDWHRP